MAISRLAIQIARLVHHKVSVPVWLVLPSEEIIRVWRLVGIVIVGKEVLILVMALVMFRGIIDCKQVIRLWCPLPLPWLIRIFWEGLWLEIV